MSLDELFSVKARCEELGDVGKDRVVDVVVLNELDSVIIEGVEGFVDGESVVVLDRMLDGDSDVDIGGCCEDGFFWDTKSLQPLSRCALMLSNSTKTSQTGQSTVLLTVMILLLFGRMVVDPVVCKLDFIFCFRSSSCRMKVLLLSSSSPFSS